MNNVDTFYSIPDAENNNYIGLLYARGFLISGMPYTVKEDWKQYNFYENLHITYDPRLECICISNSENFVLILGMVMDTEAWHMDIKRVAEKCLSKISVSKEVFYDYIDLVAGRYIICFGSREHQYIVQDATGMRTCYYAKDQLLVASHYGIIDDIIHDERHPFFEKYVNMKNRPWLLPGNITPYRNISVLTPNHELSLENRKIKRFWPRKPHEYLSAERVYEEIADLLHNQLLVLGKNHKLMFQLTKGNDSRIGLAISKPVKDESLYYSYYSDWDSSQKRDAEFSEKNAKNLGLNFVMLHNSISEDKKHDYSMLFSVLRKNHYHQHVYESVFNYFDHIPSDRINIRSNLTEIIRHGRWDFPNCTDDEECINVLSKLFAYECENKEERELISQYYFESEYNKLYNYNYVDMFYWEYFHALWMNDAVLKKDDVNFDTYMFFNCRKILELGLSVPRNFKNDNYLVYKVVNKLWPEIYEPFPNTNYKLIDYYCFNQKGLVEFKNKCTIRSSLPAEEIFVKLNRFGASIGFANSIAKKSDYIELKAEFSGLQNKCYHIQTGVSVQWSECVANSHDCNYDIYLDDMLVYSVSLNRFMNKENQINIITGFSNDGIHTVKYVLRRGKDSENVNYSSGLIHIDKLLITPRYNPNVPQNPIVRTTIDLLSEI